MASPVSLLTATDAKEHVHLIIGSNPLADTRCGQSLQVGAQPILIANESKLQSALQKRVDDGEVRWLKEDFEDGHVSTLGREEIGHVVDAVFVTSGPRSTLAVHISNLCKRKRIPVNVVDSPLLCTFRLLSTHTDGPLQIGLTTNGRGCMLGSRIRREIVASLPQNLGAACDRLGEMRRKILEEDGTHQKTVPDGDGGEDSVDLSASFNKLVTEADPDAASTRRMRWLSQVCEYWPLRRLAAITDDEVAAILESYDVRPPPSKKSQARTPGSRGLIILAGSGPGHPDLLTQATVKAMQVADLVLADKLVPAAVLDLIPRRTEVQIARKFPGNADAAQDEFLMIALAGLRAGKKVLRLKQGDPFVYGRGGEEVAFFRHYGHKSRVVLIPGITSALSAPLFATIPVTQRDMAHQVLICTGTGKDGVPPSPPVYVAGRTVVFLMALHRIEDLVRELTQYTEAEMESMAAQIGTADVDTADVPPQRPLWPANLPCAVIERASCPDQRIVRTTLDFVVEAIEQQGSRPPGLLVAGETCEKFWRPEVGIAWHVEEGFTGLDLSI